LSIVDEVGYSDSFSFKYSQRPGTPGATMADQVAEEVKTERLHRLQAAIKRRQLAFNASCRGLTFDVLMEKPGRDAGQRTGGSPYLQPVQVMAPASLLGIWIPVTIAGTTPTSLFGARGGGPRLGGERTGAAAGG